MYYITHVQLIQYGIMHCLYHILKKFNLSIFEFNAGIEIRGFYTASFRDLGQKASGHRNKAQSLRLNDSTILQSRHQGAERITEPLNTPVARLAAAATFRHRGRKKKKKKKKTFMVCRHGGIERKDRKEGGAK